MTPLHQQMDIVVSKHQPAIVLVAKNIFQDRLYCILKNHLIDTFPDKDGKDGERLSELTHDLVGPCPTQSFAFKISFKFGCLPLTCHLHGFQFEVFTTLYPWFSVNRFEHNLDLLQETIRLCKFLTYIPPALICCSVSSLVQSSLVSSPLSRKKQRCNSLGLCLCSNSQTYPPRQYYQTTSWPVHLTWPFSGIIGYFSTKMTSSNWSFTEEENNCWHTTIGRQRERERETYNLYSGNRNHFLTVDGKEIKARTEVTK